MIRKKAIEEVRGDGNAVREEVSEGYEDKRTKFKVVGSQEGNKGRSESRSWRVRRVPAFLSDEKARLMILTAASVLCHLAPSAGDGWSCR